MMKHILVAALALMAVAAMPGTALASDLGDTTWVATNESCGLDSIDFWSDGSADVYEFMSDDDDGAEWSLDGNHLTLEYDTWYGGIEGTVYADRIEATETWRSDKTKEVHHDPCIFKLDDDT